MVEDAIVWRAHHDHARAIAQEYALLNGTPVHGDKYGGRLYCAELLRDLLRLELDHRGRHAVELADSPHNLLRVREASSSATIDDDDPDATLLLGIDRNPRA